MSTMHATPKGVALAVFGAAAVLGTIFVGLREGRAILASNQDHDLDALVNYIDENPRSAFQDAILADGEISEAEIEGALGRFATCATEAGAEIVGSLDRNRWGGYSFAVGIPPAEYGVPNTAARTAVDACHAEYWSVVGERWSATHMPPADAVDEVLGKVPDCMRDRGVEPPEHTGRGWASRYLETAELAEGSVLMECLRAANDELGEGPHTFVMP